MKKRNQKRIRGRRAQILAMYPDAKIWPAWNGMLNWSYVDPETGLGVGELVCDPNQL